MNRRMGEEVAIYRVTPTSQMLHTLFFLFLFLTIIRGRGACVNFIHKVIDQKGL